MVAGDGGGARSVGGSPVQLINKDGVKVADDLGGAEDRAVAGQCGSSQ